MFFEHGNFEMFKTYSYSDSLTETNVFNNKLIML